MQRCTLVSDAYDMLIEGASISLLIFSVLRHVMTECMHFIFCFMCVSVTFYGCFDVGDVFEVVECLFCLGVVMHNVCSRCNTVNWTILVQ